MSTNKKNIKISFFFLQFKRTLTRVVMFNVMFMFVKRCEILGRTVKVHIEINLNFTVVCTHQYIQFNRKKSIS